MSRLIDADELVKLLKASTMSNGTLINTNTMLAVVEKMPTAFDTEKVVEQLEEKQYAYLHDNGDYEEGKYYAFEESIDIVKKGGVE